MENKKAKAKEKVSIDRVYFSGLIIIIVFVTVIVLANMLLSYWREDVMRMSSLDEAETIYLERNTTCGVRSSVE